MVERAQEHMGEFHREFESNAVRKRASVSSSSPATAPLPSLLPPGGRGGLRATTHPEFEGVRPAPLGRSVLGCAAVRLSKPDEEVAETEPELA